MHFTVALCSIVAMCLTALGSPAEVSINETDDDGAGVRRVFRLSAKLAPGQVVVVRSTRWENDAKVLEIEEVRGGPALLAEYTISLAELAPDYWQLQAPDSEQHLQGVRLVRQERAEHGVVLAWQSAPGAGTAQRSYRLEWEVRVEARRLVQQRHPGLPAAKAAAAWVHRRLVFPVLPAR
jgi:hypothetical protein